MTGVSHKHLSYVYIVVVMDIKIELKRGPDIRNLNSDLSRSDLSVLSIHFFLTVVLFPCWTAVVVEIIVFVDTWLAVMEMNFPKSEQCL